MDASALAMSIDLSRGADGAISLRELRTELMRRGLQEFARAVDALVERPAVLKADSDAPMAPWF
jgi:hypothetical protein